MRPKRQHGTGIVSANYDACSGSESGDRTVVALPCASVGGAIYDIGIGMIGAASVGGAGYYTSSGRDTIATAELVMVTRVVGTE